MFVNMGVVFLFFVVYGGNLDGVSQQFCLTLASSTVLWGLGENNISK